MTIRLHYQEKGRQCLDRCKLVYDKRRKTITLRRLDYLQYTGDSAAIYFAAIVAMNRRKTLTLDWFYRHGFR